MDPSKLNISAIAKEKIRKSFLSTFSLKRKKSEEPDSSCTDSACTTEESSLSCDEPCEPKMKQEANHVPAPQLNEGVMFVGKDEGFPMITSVYSLATGDPHPGNGISSEVSSDHMSGEKAETRITAQSENDPPTAATPNLPFVVQCSNGVITVCSPPRVPGVATITNHTASSSCTSKQVTQTSDSTVQAAGIFGKPSNAVSLPTTATPIASPVNKLPQHSVNDSQSSPLPSAIIPQSPKFSIIPIVNQPSLLMKENQNSDANGRFKVVYQRPILPKPDVSTPVVNRTEEESSTQLNEAEKHEEVENSPLNEEVTFTTTATAAAEAQADEADEKAEEPPSPSTDHPVEEETQEPLLVTKQDDRISRLKDLLRQQEEQLERVRFKGEGRTSGSPSSAQNLRVKLLRKNSGIGSHVPKACTVIDAQSQGSVSEPSTSTALSQDELGNSEEKQLVELKKGPTKSTAHLSTPSSLLKRKNNPETPLSTSSHKEVTSPPPKRRNSATGSQQPKVPVNGPDNYRLVNVTVVNGHTRTLAVPVDHKNEATTSKVQLKGTTAKSVQKVNKSVKTDKARKSPRKLDGTSKALETTISTQNSSSNSSDVTKEHSNHLSSSKSDISPKDNSHTTVTQASTGSEFIPGVLSKNSSELGVTKKDVVPTTAIGNHPNQISNGNASNASKKVNVTPTHQAGTQITAKPSVHNSPTKQNLGTLKFPPSQTAGNLPSQGFTVNSSVPCSVGNNLNSFVSQGSTVVTGFQLRSNPTKFSVPATKTFPSNLPIVTPNVHTKNPSINIGGSTQVNSICATNQARPVSLNASTVQNEVATIAQIAYVPKTPTQDVTSVDQKGQAITGPSSRLLYNLAPKPRPILNPGVKQNNKFLIYSLPTTVVGAASPSASVKLNNIPDGKLLICNVIPPKTTPKLGELPVSPPNSNNGKMVFYVSNQGVGKKVGVIDKRVYNPQPCLAPKNLQVEVRGKSPVKSDSEFIPNPDDTDFTKLVGLEHVVCSLNTDR